MFDRENAIVEWRRQMLSAGIKTPVPLEELESHLREEIQRQIQSGADEQGAFVRTVLQIGQGKELTAEFAKDRNLLSFLGSDKFTAIDRVLGVLWLLLCSWEFVGLVIWHLTLGRAQSLEHLNYLLIWVRQLAINGAGIWGSILLIRGSKLGRWIVGSISCFRAFFMLFILLRLIPGAETFPVVGVGGFAAFYAITALLMLLPFHSNAKPVRQ